MLIRAYGLLPAALNYAAPPPFFFEILVDRHGRQAMTGPDNSILLLLSFIQQSERV
jgi:hypothetical protein